MLNISGEGKGGLRNGMWHDLRHGIIMQNTILAEFYNFRCCGLQPEYLKATRQQKEDKKIPG